MLTDLLLNTMQSFDFGNETLKAAALETPNYVGPLNNDNLVTSAVECTLADITYNTIAAAGHVTSGNAKIDGAASINLTNVSAAMLYGGNDNLSGSLVTSGGINLNITSGGFQTIFAGGITAGSGAANGITAQLNQAEITSAFYGNGMSNNTAATSITFTGCTAKGYIYGGSVSYNSSYLVKDIAMSFVSGTYSCQIYGGSRVATDGDTACTATVDGQIQLTLSGGTFTNYIFGGGSGVSGRGLETQKTATSIVNNGVSVYLNGAVIKHELYAGGFGAANQNGNSGGGTSIVYGGTAITLKCGSAVNVYGGGYNSGNASSVYSGSVISVDGNSYREGQENLTIGSVYGGGNGIAGQTSRTGTSVVYGGSVIYLGGGYALSDNVISINNVYGGGNGVQSLVEGGSSITFRGSYTGRNAGKLNISGVVSGSGRNGGTVSGTKALNFDDFQGTLSCRIQDFDTLSTDGYTQVAFTRAIDFSNLSTVNFDFSQGEPLAAADVVLDFANDVTLTNKTAYSLSFQARSATAGTYILIKAAQVLEDLNNAVYTLHDTLSGDKFSARLGDGTSWSYYGFDISMELKFDNQSNATIVELVCQESAVSSAVAFCSAADMVAADTGFAANDKYKNGMLA